jgi:hypothetical protein
MRLSVAVAALACVLAIVLVGGYARGSEQSTAADRAAAAEAARRMAVSEHQKRKEAVTRLCGKSLMTAAELEACRAAYRKL